jgi:hypothetical protein
MVNMIMPKFLKETSEEKCLTHSGGNKMKKDEPKLFFFCKRNIGADYLRIGYPQGTLMDQQESQAQPLPAELFETACRLPG